jgi:hypothetical protein
MEAWDGRNGSHRESMKIQLEARLRTLAGQRTLGPERWDERAGTAHRQMTYRQNTTDLGTNDVAKTISPVCSSAC